MFQYFFVCLFVLPDWKAQVQQGKGDDAGGSPVQTTPRFLESCNTPLGYFKSNSKTDLYIFPESIEA